MHVSEIILPLALVQFVYVKSVFSDKTGKTKLVAISAPFFPHCFLLTRTVSVRKFTRLLLMNT